MRCHLLVLLLFVSAVAASPISRADGHLPRPGPPQCTTMADCAYNGICKDGTCVCKPQFKGDQCDQFNFVPLDPTHGTGLRTVDHTGSQVSSWGGSVLLAEDGQYHMWAAEMSGSVGIKAWITNSQIVHAVADQPGRPNAFSRKEVHNSCLCISAAFAAACLCTTALACLSARVLGGCTSVCSRADSCQGADW